MKKLNFEDLKNHWPSTLVARQSIGEFSGGILNPRTMANLDSRGEGPKGRIRIGKRSIGYMWMSLFTGSKSGLSLLTMKTNLMDQPGIKPLVVNGENHGKEM